jgi:hypothetical protein
MSCGLFLGTVGTLLFAAPCLGVSWAQNKPPPVPPFLSGSEITLEMSYSCPSNTACSFACPSGVGAEAAEGPEAAPGPGAAGGLGTVGFFGADHVTKLTIYLGTMPFGNRDAPVLFYDFSTRERSNSSGFSINAGPVPIKWTEAGLFWSSTTCSGARTLAASEPVIAQCHWLSRNQPCLKSSGSFARSLIICRTSSRVSNLAGTIARRDQLSLATSPPNCSAKARAINKSEKHQR